MAKKNDHQVDDSIESLPKIKECFIITPIGSINSDTYIKANGLINSIIQPVLDEFKYKAVAAHQISVSGSINNQLIKMILECDLVIANLTGLNPNVMYELAIRHSVRKPVIIMCEKAITPRLPFDVTDQRTIFYDDTLAGSEEAKPVLYAFVESALNDDKPDNPIYAAATQENIFKDLDEGDPLTAIMAKIDSIGTAISTLQINQPDKTIEKFKPDIVYSRKRLKGYVITTTGTKQTLVSNELRRDISQRIQNAFVNVTGVMLYEMTIDKSGDIYIELGYENPLQFLSLKNSLKNINEIRMKNEDIG